MTMGPQTISVGQMLTVELADAARRVVADSTVPLGVDWSWLEASNQAILFGLAAARYGRRTR